ncbi:MAG: septum formation initiator family protein [Crocinitomicaceae bacterium]|jgi:cell division protein DivIC|nr:septum formation initiator family protein [Crocinitomicaceae bacterium]MDP4760289.1 septum formation initiator family protein [Crocinitomicaceae bacterium]
MKIHIPNYLRNKYTLTGIVFMVYFLFLDDWDVFTLVSQQRKLNALTEQKGEMSKQLKQTKQTLRRLKNPEYLEAYARSEKFFKRDDEEIFVITYK